MCQNQTHLTLQLLNANFIKGLNLLKMHIGRMYSILLEKIFDNPIFLEKAIDLFKNIFAGKPSYFLKTTMFYPTLLSRVKRISLPNKDMMHLHPIP